MNFNSMDQRITNFDGVRHLSDIANFDDIRQLSDFQEKVLAILPIPSAILSVFGSMSIIYMVLRRKEHRSTPYTRLLAAMSLCDIVFSTSLAIGAFMRPQETSHKAWAFGNEATCTVSGFLEQFSRSAILYNGMLSFYFLLVARFGWKNHSIARRVEPAMHVVALGFPLVTAIVGATFGVFYELEMGFGCWVSNYPRNCGDGPGQTGEKCLSPIIGTFYGAIPLLLVFFCLVVNNWMIWNFVRRQTKPRSAREVSQSTTQVDTSSTEFSTLPSSCSLDDDNSDASSIGSSSTGGSIQSELKLKRSSSVRKGQFKRLQLVRSQALLFVGSYFICNLFWPLTILVEKAATTEAEEVEALADFYFLVVLNAIFLPLQGFLNMFVFIRPKYLKARKEFPEESKLWALREVLYGGAVKDTRSGKKVKPTAPHKAPQNDPEVSPTDNAQNRAHKNEDIESATKDMAAETSKQKSEDGKPTDQGVDASSYKPLPPEALQVSSISASSGDFDEDDASEGNDDRWGTPQDMAASTPIKESRRRKPSARSLGGHSLEAISELTEMSFVEAEEEEVTQEDDQQVSSSEHVVRRWSDITTLRQKRFDQKNDSPELSLVMPRRAESQTQVSMDLDEETATQVSDRSVDLPIRAPTRRLSPPPVELDP